MFIIVNARDRMGVGKKEKSWSPAASGSPRTSASDSGRRTRLQYSTTARPFDLSTDVNFVQRNKLYDPQQ